MKTVRFSKVVETAGAPEAHLLLTDPAKDRALQAAVKANRVMTVLQETVGTKTDRGEVGFQPGPNRQFLVFPKSLRAFADKSVVGIKYDLLEAPDVPKSQRVTVSRPKKKSQPKPEPKQKPADKPAKPKADSPSGKKVVAFAPPAPAEEAAEDEAVTELKKKVRQAMKALEDGKQVAAFNLLKRIVGDE